LPSTGARAAQDKPLGPQAQISGKATIDVNVKAPRSTQVKAKADGVFDEVKMNKTTQMAPSGSSEDSAYAEE
jgi:hypothetical protein